MLIYSANTMAVPRQAEGGNQGLHLSEIRSAHNGLARLWAALYVSQLSLISPRKMQRIAPTFRRTCYLKTHFPFVICSVYNYVFRTPSALEPFPP